MSFDAMALLRITTVSCHDVVFVPIFFCVSREHTIFRDDSW